MAKMKELFLKLLEMYEQGKSVEEIAAFTGLPVDYIAAVLVVESEDTP